MGDDIRSQVIAAAEKMAADFGIDQRSEDSFISVCQGEDRGWDRLYRITLPALPGGTSHMAHVMAATAPLSSCGNMRLDQLEHLMRGYKRRFDRVRAIQAAGLDPFKPPLWSLRAKRSTSSVLRSLASKKDDLGDIEPIYTGELIAHVPLNKGGVTKAYLGDDILTWSDHVDVPRAQMWYYDDAKGQIRIYGMRMPETLCPTIVGAKLSSVVDDEALSQVDLTIESAMNEGETIILVLEKGWEWLAPIPENIDASWRNI